MKNAIAFRVDATRALGMGHLYRCLALMDALAEHGLRGVFVLQGGDESVWRVVRERGFTLEVLSEHATSGRTPARTDEGSERLDAERTLRTLEPYPVAAVVVDHYGLAREWEQAMARGTHAPVVAIDGLADRPHVADLLIDPTYLPHDVHRWRGRVGSHTRVLRGPRYALIAPHFAQLLKGRSERDGTVRHVLISFGGGDTQGLTARAVLAVSSMEPPLLGVDVVVGSASPEIEEVRALVEGPGIGALHVNTSNMAGLMSRADLAIGAGGVTTYERAFLGLPALVVIAADNQAQQARSVAETGAIRVLGTPEFASEERFRAEVGRLAVDPSEVRAMSQASRLLMSNDTVPGSIRVAAVVVETML